MNEKEIQNLIHQTKKLVLSTIQKYIHKETISYIDDIVQDVYLRLIVSLQNGQFKNKSKITTYLYKIAKNETLRYNEKVLKENQKMESIKEIWQNTNKLFYKDNNQTRILKEQIVSKSKYLNSTQKEILTLYLKGYKLKEIAKILNLQEGTVKSNLFRIKNKIKKNET
ncbi:MAG: RNA polymerase sigma factor [Leptospiraceae bacterium]|nr:MAG: RNA polymerase sigma factor [Leptospiraceae bacterium]